MQQRLERQQLDQQQLQQEYLLRRSRTPESADVLDRQVESQRALFSLDDKKALFPSTTTASSPPPPRTRHSTSLLRPGLFSFCFGVLAAALTPAAGWAQTWPSKPVRWIVPFAPGGGVDVTTRTIANRLGAKPGLQFVIDNRGGANGNIGVELAVKAPPDGYTLLMATTGNIVINPHLYGKLSFDPVKDLTPVTPAVDVINVLVVHPALPTKSVKELIALAKARPNQLNFASSGAGGSDHIAAELFKSMSGTQLVNVSYKGGAPAMVDVLAGNVEVMFATMAVAIGPIKAGRLRPLGVTSSKRYALLPELPTIAEAGLRGYEAAFWFGTFVPTGTPREIVTRLNSEIRSVLQLPEIQQRLLESGLVATGSTPEEFAAFVQSESQKWAKLVKERGLKRDRVSVIYAASSILERKARHPFQLRRRSSHSFAPRR